MRQVAHHPLVIDHDLAQRWGEILEDLDVAAQRQCHVDRALTYDGMSIVARGSGIIIKANKFSKYRL
jgi:hypothetical protein